jgi:ABC-type dipeptide/oligopeptide/nickel transport system ATPase component
VLHASVVATGNSAAAFLGHSGSGKSTLAMAMVRAGARLLADDMAVIRFDNGSPRVMPGAGRARLSRNVAAVLGINPSLLHPIPGQRRKCWLELDPAHRIDQPCTLRTVYLLKRGTTVGTSFVGQRERLTSLLEFPFWAEMVSGATLPKFFHDCARVARGTTVRTVSRPLKLSHLQETTETICEQMRAETG